MAGVCRTVQPRDALPAAPVKVPGPECGLSENVSLSQEFSELWGSMQLILLRSRNVTRQERECASAPFVSLYSAHTQAGGEWQRLLGFICV